MDLNSRNKSIIGVMLDKQPYEAVIAGIDITVCKGVFPSDLGLTTEHLIRAAQQYNSAAALDMGCGAGVIAIALKKAGVSEVWAADYHQPAVDCAKENAKRHKNYGEITILLSDLFEDIEKGKRFDLIVFNHPYAPQNSSKRRYSKDGRGGREVIGEFFKQALEHLGSEGKILMPYSEIAGPEHSPELISKDFDLQCRKVLEVSDKDNGGHMIFEFSKL